MYGLSGNRKNRGHKLRMKVTWHLKRGESLLDAMKKYPNMDVWSYNSEDQKWGMPLADHGTSLEEIRKLIPAKLPAPQR